MNKKTKQINIAVNPEILKKLEDGNYNKNKLINDVLKKFLEEKEK